MSNKLNIGVHPSLFDMAPIEALREKGHNIYLYGHEVDLILGPTCWRMDAHLLPYLDLALRAARKAKKEKT